MTAFNGDDRDADHGGDDTVDSRHVNFEPASVRSTMALMGSSSEVLHSYRRHPSDNGEDPVVSSPGGRRRSLQFGASHTMDRLRTTFLAESPSTLIGLLPHMGSSSDDADQELAPNQTLPQRMRKSHRVPDPSSFNAESEKRIGLGKMVQNSLGQIPAIILIALFHLMIGIPFGVSYFPIGWKSSTEEVSSNNATTASGAPDDFVNGPFPLPGKEALGIRMFLYATIIAQVVLALRSDFHSAIGLEMVENVPFYHELAATAIKHCGYGMEALVTLFFMFGIASVIVGIVFYGLGKFELGRITYYFPVHVLVGCIGGIGLYIARTGLEVTMDVALTVEHIMEYWQLLRVTIMFEIILRILERVTLDAEGKPRYALLSPIYFCSITPIFYLGLLILQVPVQDARDDGYFFPAIETASSGTATTSNADGGIWQSIMSDEGIFDMWRHLDIRVVSWKAIFESIPTMIALTLFSLIHVPINIPALGISTNTDVDMNNELIAHGYSNFLSGICGCGLQNYLAYTQSVVYHRSGGRGRPSGIAVAIVTAALFVVGPTIASFIPRAMAGSLLLHVGIDLFLEGVYDSWEKFDGLEYAGIWLIVIVMTLQGMEAAMIAGIIAAVSTIAVQNSMYLNPIRGSMSAATLRSSHRNRNYQARDVLDCPHKGRARIIVIQLQGHLFFGNFAQLTTGIHNRLNEMNKDIEGRRIVILDFTLVVGIDSSAAQGLIKLKESMQKKHRVDVCIHVTGSEDGFPCEFDLSKELTTSHHHNRRIQNRKQAKKAVGDACTEVVTEATSLLHATGSCDSLLLDDEECHELMNYSGSFVMESLDLALIFAENILICWEDPTLLDDYDPRVGVVDHFDPKWKEHSHNPPSLITNAMLYSSHSSTNFASEEEEKETVLKCFENMNPDRIFTKQDMEVLLSYFTRQTYAKDEYLWRQNEASDCAKLLLSGMLMAMLENEAGTSELISSGNLIGELGLVRGIARMSSVQCISDDGAIVYSLSRDSYEELIKSNPQAARFIDLVCIQYLANRVQHVSNRIFETRCLPI
ncbi:solute carrier family 26 [Seminavis robusta]|uniref:Solute carrier family 26 n=1 Tax=Seminavis robusta TaxID=568900 RepID=A0A9N8F1N0_9STRA|nr:solute carrier family 26 [Seminavis robusta]|eukprot:Sro2304_g322590.1 solute carrier family 26 (1041) ;mRNA; f:11335-14753